MGTGQLASCHTTPSIPRGVPLWPVPTSMAAMKPPRSVSRSRSAKDQSNEISESVYALGHQADVGVAPRVRTYNVAPADQPSSSHAGGAASPKVRMHADSSQIESIFNPVRGPRDAQARAGIKPVNHARNNVQSVREASQINALRKQSDTEERPGLKLPPVRSTSAPTRRDLLRSDSGGRNFVAENRMGAAAPVRPPRTASREDDQYLKKKDYGQVPQYLLERKMEMAAEVDAQQRAKEAALIPPGMRLLPEEERLETLQILQKNREEVERAIQGLPLRIETPSAIRRKDELERRYKEIEDAFKIFSRPKVLVHL